MRFVGLNWLPGGVAVEAFFVISGFYMQLVLREKYTCTKLGGRWWTRFYLARYFRLLPAYLICLPPTIFVAIISSQIHHALVPPLTAWAALTTLPPTLNNVLLSGWVLISNITMLFQDLGGVLAVQGGQAFLTLDRGISDFYVWHSLALPHCWSLGVELLFYVSAPYLLNVSNRTLAAFFFLGLALKIGAIVVLDPSSDLPFRMFPFVLANFLAGSLAYRYRTCFLMPVKLAFALLLAFVLILPSFFEVRVMSLISLVVVTITIPALFESTRNNPWDSFIGELSYPFYIFHMLCTATVSSFLKHLYGNYEAGNVLALGSLIFTLVVSIIVFKIEFRYLEPWRKTFSTPTATVRCTR